jgi:ribose transport system substrate-binding protein
MLFNTGCKQSSVDIAEKKKTFEVIVKMKESDFWQTVHLGAGGAGKELGVNINFNAPDNEEDIESQIKLVSDAIDRKVDGIVLAACDYKKLVSISEKAIDQGIPVVIIDSALDSARVSSFIATDNIQAGKKVGKKLVELAGEKANAAIISFVEGTVPANEREEGVMQIIGQYPEIKLLAKEYCHSDIKLASELTRRIISKYEKVDVMIGLNAPATIGIANALKDMHLENAIKVIGFDSTPEEVDYIEDGIIQAAVVQNPYNMGYLGVKHLFEAVNNKSVPKYVDTGSKVIDKSNIYTPENQKLLFPFVK